MESMYPLYAWEAIEVEADNVTKTLFHITGSYQDDKFKPKRQPVLITTGLMTNVLSSVNTASSALGTKAEYA